MTAHDSWAAAHTAIRVGQAGRENEMKEQTAHCQTARNVLTETEGWGGRDRDRDRQTDR